VVLELSLIEQGPDWDARTIPTIIIHVDGSKSFHETKILAAIEKVNFMETFSVDKQFRFAAELRKQLGIGAGVLYCSCGKKHCRKCGSTKDCGCDKK